LRKSIKICAGVLLASVSLNACVYANVGMPLDDNVDNTVLGAKRGEAHSHAVAGLVAWGDRGTAAAAKAGGIETITHLDAKYLIVLFGIYSRATTVAYGN
jgi:hypothetical protein